MTERKLFNKRDIYFFIILLLTACAVFIWNKYGGETNISVIAEIRVNGILLETIELTENRIFSLDTLPRITFEVKNNSVAFISSDCPDKICINEGFLSIAGQTAVCLPNRVSLSVVPANPENNNGIDIILMND